MLHVAKLLLAKFYSILNIFIKVYHFAFLGSFNGGWISQYTDAYQFYQIELGSVTKVTRIATQGRDDAVWWTKTYTIDYSVDGGIFQPYGKVSVYANNYPFWKLGSILICSYR